MAQEYHNWITYRGTLELRLEITRAIMNSTPRNWEWYRISINEEARNGCDSGETTLSLYTRNFPQGIADLSEKFPDVGFECRCMDLTAEIQHLFTFFNGIEVEYTVEPVVWEGTPNKAEVEEPCDDSDDE